MVPILPGILYVSVALTVSVTMHFTSTNIINSESSIHPINLKHQAYRHQITPSNQSSYSINFPIKQTHPVIPSTRT